MVPMYVAVVPFAEPSDAPTLQDAETTDAPTLPDLMHVTAALQVQVLRDFAPIWDVTATVALFKRLEEIPPGYLPLVILSKSQVLPAHRAGVHFATGGRPFAMVRYSDSWSVIASHELLEMLCDPWGNRTLPGASLKPEQGQVEYLLEVCDPCQRCYYTIDGVLVSDFVTPQYYAPGKTQGARYSFTGAVTRPREVRKGGYITWRVPGKHDEIWQVLGDGEPANLGSSTPGLRAVRQWVDDRVDSAFVVPARLDDKDDQFIAAREAYRSARTAAQHYGEALRRDIQELLPGGGPVRMSVIKLMEELASDPDVNGVRYAFQTDPHRVLEARGIDPIGMPKMLTTLAPPAVFEWVAKRMKEGDRFGDGDTTPAGSFWWLGVLGGG
jgi:hypothetical protein